jgi:GNAT superfamily N-acetyltransferase
VDGRDVLIRPATRADLPAILSLYVDDTLALRPPGDDPEPYERAFAEIERDPRTAIYVATKGGAVVGTFQATVLRHLTTRVIHLESVHVHSSERGRGVGTRMMQWALEDARTKACTRAVLTTQKRRVDAHRFYERLGFVRSHEGMKLDLAPVV